MDLVDIRILRAIGLRAFQGRPRAPADVRPRAIADRVGLSRESVRQRIDAMREARVLLGHEIVPNYRLLDAATTTYHLRPRPGSKPEIVATWRRDSTVAGVFEFLSDDLCIDVLHPKGVASDPATPGSVIMGGDGHPEPDGEPSPLEWKVLRALRHAPQRPLEDAAAEIGCSTRAARRAARALADRRFADVVAVVDPSAMEGLVAGLLSIQWDADDAPALIQELGDHTAYWWRAPDGIIWVAAFARSPGALEDLRDDVARRPGVRAATCLVPGRVATDASWIDERIDQHVAAGRTAKARVAPSHFRRGR